MFKEVCLHFLGNVKAKSYKELVEDKLNAYQTMGCNMSLKIHFLTFPLGLLPSESGHIEWRTCGKVPPGFFYHGEKICRKVVTEHISWLLLEPYWRGIYYQLQTNELQKEVWNVTKIKHLFSHFCCVMAKSYFHTAFLPLFLNFLWSFQHEKVILKYIIVDSSKI